MNVLNPTVCPPVIGVLTVTLNVFAVTLETSNIPLLNLVLLIDAGSVGRGYGCSVTKLSSEHLNVILSSSKNIYPHWKDCDYL